MGPATCSGASAGSASRCSRRRCTPPLLLAVGAWVLVEAQQRLREPTQVQSGTMLVFALLGGLGNLVSLRLLAGASRESLNVRGAYLEVLADLLGSAAVIVAALVIRFTGFDQAVVAVLIAVAIVPHTLRLLREASRCCWRRHRRGWTWPRSASTCSRRAGCSTCTTCTPGPSPAACRCSAGTSWSTPPLAEDHGAILTRIGACLAEDFDVAHCTFQLESPDHRGHEKVPLLRTSALCAMTADQRDDVPLWRCCVRERAVAAPGVAGCRR